MIGNERVVQLMALIKQKKEKMGESCLCGTELLRLHLVQGRTQKKENSMKRKEEGSKDE